MSNLALFCSVLVFLLFLPGRTIFLVVFSNVLSPMAPCSLVDEVCPSWLNNAFVQVRFVGKGAVTWAGSINLSWRFSRKRKT